MHHLPRIFARSKGDGPMEKKNNRRRPRLERRNALKHIDYDAGPSCSSIDESSSSSLVTRSLDLSGRTSFRVEGTEEGEFDRICRSLGLTGPDDFSIPSADWTAMKIRSASDVLPRSKLYELDSPRVEENEQEHDSEEKEEEQQESELCARVLSSVRISDATELTPDKPVESAEFNARCRVVTCATVGGIKGVRPPSLKPPPCMTLPVIDNTCSTWDIFRNLAPENNRGSFVVANRDLICVYEEGEERRHGLDDADATKGEEEEEENLLTIVSAVLSESDSFTTSNDDGSSCTTISPNERFRRIITYWEKGDLLGRGSFGSVYEGISDDGFFFAVKEVSLLDQGSQGRQSICQLEQEILLLSQFEHENIVQYYGTERNESNLYIFLQLVTKGSLMSLYQRYHLRDSQVSAYTRQILHGLKYLHDQNVVHRDIKCANILVDADGSVKLADFGLAKATKLNDVKSCKGTAFWMAPEVVNRKNQGYGLPADIWSLGCTVLEMLTRQIPYSDFECQMQALFRIGRGIPPTVPDSLSQDAQDFILQCLQVNPNDRPTAVQLLEHPFVRRPLATSSGSTSPYIGRRS